MDPRPRPGRPGPGARVKHLLWHANTFRAMGILEDLCGERVVLDVDGETHYATSERPDPHQYADGVRADRELKLAGYEVYCFGATELQDPDGASALVGQFFTDLFQHYDISPL